MDFAQVSNWYDGYRKIWKKNSCYARGHPIAQQFFLLFYLIVGFQCSDGNALRGLGICSRNIFVFFFKLPVVRAVLLIKKEKLKICDITGIYKEADKVTH